MNCNAAVRVSVGEQFSLEDLLVGDVSAVNPAMLSALECTVHVHTSNRGTNMNL